MCMCALGFVAVCSFFLFLFFRVWDPSNVLFGCGTLHFVFFFFCGVSLVASLHQREFGVAMIGNKQKRQSPSLVVQNQPLGVSFLGYPFLVGLKGNEKETNHSWGFPQSKTSRLTFWFSHVAPCFVMVPKGLPFLWVLEPSERTNLGSA